MFDNIALNREFYDEKWTKNRVVTSLDWSTQVLLLVFSLIINGILRPRFGLWSKILNIILPVVSHVAEVKVRLTPNIIFLYV